jgi:hypothetical protein
MFFLYNDMSGAQPVVKVDRNEPGWRRWGTGGLLVRWMII